jgi:hypothetical protein
MASQQNQAAGDVKPPKAYHLNIRQQAYDLAEAGFTNDEILRALRHECSSLSARTLQRWRNDFINNIAAGLHPVTGNSGQQKDPLPPDVWEKLKEILDDEPRLYLHEMSERLPLDDAGNQ